MRRFAFTVTLALFGLTLLIFLMSPNTKIAIAQQSTSSNVPRFFSNLNSKSGEIKNLSGFTSAESQAQVRNMVDEAFQLMALDDLPVTLTDSLKDRVARAEITYRKGESAGVPEIDVVRAINGLMMRFNAPEWAKTYDDEVKSSRVGLAELCPNLVTFSGAGASSQISSVMSPTEAVYLFSVIFEQKRSNGLYQMTYTEKKQFQAQSVYQPANLEIAAENRDRQNELNLAILSALRGMPGSEILDIPQRALDVLGIPR